MRNSVVSLMFVLFFVLPAQGAGAPNAVNYQGVLRDADGEPRDGSFDMRFRFFDADTLGSELLIDQHLAAGTGAVVVTGGLFNVALGSGDVLDGSGPGVFTSMGYLFGQVEGVWLEIEIGGETLSPRVVVLSSAYSLNTARFQGKEPDEFLDTLIDTAGKGRPPHRQRRDRLRPRGE